MLEKARDADAESISDDLSLVNMETEALAEWFRWAERLKTRALETPEDFHAAAMALSDAEFQELSSFYAQAEERNDIAQVAAWLRANGGGVPMGRQERALRNLFHLFSNIAKCWGRRPFINQTLNAMHLPDPTPDWSTVPEDFRALSLPAEHSTRFTYVFSEEGREYIRETVSPKEVAKFDQAAAEVRRIGYERIRSWWIARGTKLHVEARLLSHLMGVLDALGLLNDE